MKYVQMATILICLAFASVATAQVPVDLENDVFDIGLTVTEEIPEGKADTLIVYSAGGCMPCLMMRPIWASLRLWGYKVVDINVNDPHKHDARRPYQTAELVDRCMATKPEKVPTIRWYNSDSEKFLTDEDGDVMQIVGRTSTKKVKEHLWKTSSSRDYQPVRLR